MSPVTLSPADAPGPSPKTCLAVIVRHGETAYNRENLFRGRYDVPLDETGRQQARLTADFLASGKAFEPPSALYSSPLRRARETAAPLERLLGLKAVVAEELNDVDVGRWEGRPAKEVAAEDPGLYRSWHEAPADFAFPGGESLYTVYRRVAGFLGELPSRHNGRTVVLFTHRVPAKLMIARVLGLGAELFWRVKIDNCSINVAQLGGETHVLTLVNSTSHLLRGDEESGRRTAKPDF